MNFNGFLRLVGAVVIVAVIGLGALLSYDGVVDDVGVGMCVAGCTGNLASGVGERFGSSSNLSHELNICCSIRCRSDSCCCWSVCW